jgi:hypothetical protein
VDVPAAVADVLLGASMRQVAIAYRQSLIEAFGFRPDEVTASTFADETTAFMKKLARQLGDKHAGDVRVERALLDWVHLVDHYEAWDALLSGFSFHGKEALIRRGRMLFPGTLTAHWSDAG